MEARLILERIKQRGFTIKAVGDSISLSPKKLLNNRMINFVREHKQTLLTALYQEEDDQKAKHRDRKLALPKDRLHISRILLHRFLNDAKCRDMVNYKGSSQIINDEAIETMIEIYRVYTPQPILQCKCGYQAPFCSCGGIPMTDIVSCHQCEHFTPDYIGDGAGIGQCDLGITWTQELNGQMPLYRHADRHCDKFSRLMN